MARAALIFLAAFFLTVIALPVEKDVIVDDMVMSQKLLDAMKSGRNGLFNRKWPTNEIPVHIDAAYTPAQRQHIEDALWLIEDGGCIQFHIYDPTSDVNWLHIRPNDGIAGLCNAALGFIGGYQYVNAPVRPGGSDCFDYPARIAHEVLHSLGYVHMHQTATRDEFIEILWENIPDPRNNFDIWEDSNLMTTQYDFGSVMHYSKGQGASAGTNAFEPIVTVPPGVQIGQRQELTSGDYDRVWDIYCAGRVKNSEPNGRAKFARK